MSGDHRRGLRMKPPGGWPLDEVLVGVGTLRTIRELVRQDHESAGEPARAWDLALWSGVTAQGSTKCLERLRRAGLVAVVPPDRPWRAAAYRLERHHPLVSPLARLLEAERDVVRQSRATRRDPRTDRDTSTAER